MPLPILKFILYSVLPGYIVGRLLSHRQPKISLSECLSWTALSHPIVAFIGLVFLLLGKDLTLAGWFLDGLLILLGSVYVVFLYQTRSRQLGNIGFSWDILLSIAGILVVFIPMLGPRNWFAYHGFWHFGIVNSILAGHFPPENPGFAGHPISYVWLYHIWVSLLAIKTDLHPVFINLTGHIHLLIALLGLSVLVARSWGYAGRTSTLGFWMLIGSINIGALIHLLPYIAYWVTSPQGLFDSYQAHANQNIHPLLSLTGTMLKVPVFQKSWSFLIKFYNFGAMAHGITFFFFFAWSLHTLFEEEGTAKNWAIYSITFLGLLLFYPVFLAFATLFASVYCGLRWLMDRCSSLVAKCGVVSAFICTVCLPYFLYLGTTTGTTGVPVFSISFNPTHLWIYGLGPFWPLLPVLGYWIFKTRRQDKNPGKAAFLTAGLLVSLVSPVFVAIYGGASNYKYVYLAALFVAWCSFSVLAVDHSAASNSIWKWFRSGYALLAAGPILLTILGWSMGPWFDNNHITIASQSITSHRQDGSAEVLEWISTQTKKDAVLLVPLTETDSKASTTYVLASLTGRSLYVANDQTWAGGYDSYKHRKGLAKYIWGASDLTSDSVQFDQHLKGRPLYLLYSENAELTAEFYSQMMGPVQTLVYQNGQIRDRIENVGGIVTQVFGKDQFKVLKIAQ